MDIKLINCILPRMAMVSAMELKLYRDPSRPNDPVIWHLARDGMKDLVTSAYWTKTGNIHVRQWEE